MWLKLTDLPKVSILDLAHTGNWTPAAEFTSTGVGCRDMRGRSVEIITVLILVHNDTLIDFTILHKNSACLFSFLASFRVPDTLIVHWQSSVTNSYTQIQTHTNKQDGSNTFPSTNKTLNPLILMWWSSRCS